MAKPDNSLREGFLFTDYYELTMAQLYFRAGIHETPAQFDHFFRNYPDYGSHQAGYCINAGLQWLLEWMRNTSIQPEEINHLKSLRNRSGTPVFSEDFLAWLGVKGHFGELAIESVPEGRTVHPNEPLTVVRGPLAIAQLLESSLLNQLNYQTLVATKAARIRDSGRGRPLVDFGMRRAQGLGANAAARAALIGGADFTSNTGVSLELGLPPKGTHAHSMVQAFIALGGDEREAFQQYAETYPDDCILLVDTVDTLNSGLPNAIKVFEKLQGKGHEPGGVRLDSGDLAYLAVEAAAMLDKAGFPNCKIVLSNQLDEHVLQQILRQIEDQARRSGRDPDSVINRLAYGVGTHLVTSAGAPALDGVYKLVGLRREGEMQSAIKLSETPSKIPNPGSKKLWRIYDRRGMATADLLCEHSENPRQQDPLLLRHPVETSVYRRLRQKEWSEIEPLLVPVFDQGRTKSQLPNIDAIRRQRNEDLARLDSGVRRIVNPHLYHVSLSESLWNKKQAMIERARAGFAEGGCG